MDAILRPCRQAVRCARIWKTWGHPLALTEATIHLNKAFAECNRLGRHDLRARVCRMRNWVAAELARAA